MINRKDIVVEKDLFTEKKIRIHTIAMSSWRLAKARNIPLLDITAKGQSAFSPGYAAVVQYKAGMTPEDVYTHNYIERMREYIRSNPDAWKVLLNEPEIALACYCKAGDYCHRHIFANLMQKYCESMGYVVEQMGELIKEK